MISVESYSKAGKLVNDGRIQEQLGNIYLVRSSDNQRFYTVNVITAFPGVVKEPKVMCTCDHGKGEWKIVQEPLNMNDFCYHILAALFMSTSNVCLDLSEDNDTPG